MTVLPTPKRNVTEIQSLDRDPLRQQGQQEAHEQVVSSGTFSSSPIVAKENITCSSLIVVSDHLPVSSVRVAGDTTPCTMTEVTLNCGSELAPAGFEPHVPQDLMFGSRGP